MSPNPWLPYKRGHVPARLRLVCLPHAGGGASAYRPWIDALPGVEVLPVQPPGREGRFREPAFDRLPPLVKAIADAISPIPEPFALFGHSLGALTAFELAREFRRRGAPMPTMLVVSGRAAPHLPARFPPLHKLPDAEFVAALRQFGGTPAAVLDNAELMQAYLPLLRADFAAHETYEFVAEPPLGLPIAVLYGRRDLRLNNDEIREWGREDNDPSGSMTPSEVGAHIGYDGDHFFLQPCRDEVLRDLRQELWLGADVRVNSWQLPLDHPLTDTDWQYLDDVERARAGRFLVERDRRRFVLCRGLLRSELENRLGVPPQNVRFETNAAGKPRVAGTTPVRFNVSHTADFAVVATAVGREVGVDVEFVRDDLAWHEIAAHVFAPAEVADIAALPPDEQRLGFYRVWTRKEAYLKALGLGLSVPLDRFRVSVGEPARLLAADHDPSQLGRWSLESLEVPPGYVGALCVEDASQKRR